MADPAPAPPLTLEALTASAMKVLMSNPLFAIGEAEIRGNQYRVFQNIPPHLGAFFAETISANKDKPFISYEGESWTYGELWSEARRFAAAMKDRYGVKQGDHVALAMRNYPEWCIAYIGLISMGAVVVPLNAWWKGDELKFGFEDSGAKIAVVDGRRLELIKPFAKEMGLTLVLARDKGEGADARMNELIKEADEADLSGVDIAPDDRFAIVYTSGSTGHPKGVILTHRGALSALYSWYFISELLRDARNGVSLFGDDPAVLLVVPLFHVTGTHSIFLLSFLLGRRLVMMRRWDPEEAARLINEHRITNFVGVPSQSYELMQAAGNNGLPSLVDVASGGAKRPPEHVKRLAKAFDGATPSSGYGLSETNALGSVISHNFYQDRPGSTGRPAPPITDIKIVKDGEDAPRGVVGEIWIRTPANFEGYWNRPEETKKALTEDGWFRTGDLGSMDEEDFITIHDRLKDIIIRGGENISCLEVEAGAYEYEHVAEAAAFATPDETLGEKVGLVVYPRDGAEVKADVLRAFMAERMADFKVPERIWVSPAPLPRLGTEKFDKMTIKRIAMQHPPDLKV